MFSMLHVLIIKISIEYIFGEILGSLLSVPSV